MRPLEFPLLADENVHPEVVAYLKSLDKDVRTVHDEVLVGASDADILQRAFEQRRAVITHDSDFGTLAVYAGLPCIGIVYFETGASGAHIRRADAHSHRSGPHGG
jgi:predicted nuclease of predicted toxin-antitoxin system